jgi:membrane dipeptidase
LVPVVDLHEDISTYFMLHGGGYRLADFSLDVDGRDADIPKYLRGGVRLVFASIFTGLETFDPGVSKAYYELYGVWVPGITFRGSGFTLLEQVRIYYRLVENHRELSIVTSYGDVEGALRDTSRVGLLLHIEGAEPLADPYDLKILHMLGVRSIGLTWNHCNKYGCGASAKKDYGLTDEGEELVRTANRLGVIVDIAHASKRTALDTLAIAKKPVMISHANLRRFVDTPRNVDDEVLEALNRNGGIIGLSCIGPLIARGRQATVDDLVEQHLYINQTYGPHMAAIGTDFLGLLGLPAPKGFESIDRVVNLLEKLREKGLGDRDIERVAYENALRIIKAHMS